MKVFRQQRTVDARTRRKRGVAAVETALVLPVLLLVMFGTMNASQLMYFRKSLVVAADEGVRLASQRDSTSADIQSRINAVLTSRRVTNSTVTLVPDTFENSKPGDMIQVQIQANFTGMGFGLLGQNAQLPVTVTSVILRE